jgi:hypothetical protein
LCDSLAEDFDVEKRLEDTSDPRFDIESNVRRYLQGQVLSKVSTHLIWELDEVDRLVGCPFGGDVLRFLCTLERNRARDPNGWWERLTLVIAYFTEGQLFMADLGSILPCRDNLLLPDFTPK